MPLLHMQVHMYMHYMCAYFVGVCLNNRLLLKFCYEKLVNSVYPLLVFVLIIVCYLIFAFEKLVNSVHALLVFVLMIVCC